METIISTWPERSEANFLFSEGGVPVPSSHYDHPMQRVSVSLTSAFPALTGLSKEDMLIGAGYDASLAFLTLIFEEVADEEESRLAQ